MTFVQERQVLISVGLNEDAQKSQNPHIPYAVDEVVDSGVAACEAGAALVHFHARFPDGRQAKVEPEPTRAILQGLADRCGAIAFPTTYPPAEGGDLRLSRTAPHMWPSVEPPVGPPPHVMPFDMFRRGDIFEPGGLALWDPVSQTISSPGVLGSGAAAPTQWDPPEFLTDMLAHGLVPTFICFDLGDLRWVLALTQTGVVPQPLLVQFHLFGRLLWGAPPSRHSLDAAHGLWHESGVDGELLYCAQAVPTLQQHDDLLDHALGLGMGIRTGIGDNPHLFPTQTNAELVSRMVEQAKARGLSPVSTSTLRSRFMPARRKGEEIP